MSDNKYLRLLFCEKNDEGTFLCHECSSENEYIEAKFEDKLLFSRHLASDHGILLITLKEGVPSGKMLWRGELPTVPAEYRHLHRIEADCEEDVWSPGTTFGSDSTLLPPSNAGEAKTPEVSSDPSSPIGSEIEPIRHRSRSLSQELPLDVQRDGANSVMDWVEAAVVSNQNNNKDESTTNSSKYKLKEIGDKNNSDGSKENNSKIKSPGYTVERIENISPSNIKKEVIDEVETPIQINSNKTSSISGNTRIIKAIIGKSTDARHSIIIKKKRGRKPKIKVPDMEENLLGGVTADDTNVSSKSVDFFSEKPKNDIIQINRRERRALSLNESSKIKTRSTFSSSNSNDGDHLNDDDHDEEEQDAQWFIKNDDITETINKVSQPINIKHSSEIKSLSTGEKDETNIVQEKKLTTIQNIPDSQVVVKRKRGRPPKYPKNLN